MLHFLGYVVVVDGHGGIFALDVGQIVCPLNYSGCDTKHRLPFTITNVIVGSQPLRDLIRITKFRKIQW